MNGPICLNPIGFVGSPVTEAVDEQWGNVIARISLLPEYANGLSGLQQFSHAIIVTFLHQATYDSSRHLCRHPQNLKHMPQVGIFSQRAKNRPNPIGISAVRILEVGNDFLEVQGLDSINETPVLDIKPYYPQYDRIDSPVVPDWVNKLMSTYF